MAKRQMGPIGGQLRPIGDNSIANVTVSVATDFENDAGPISIPNGSGNIAELLSVTTTTSHQGGALTFEGDISSSGGGDRTLILEIYLNGSPTGISFNFTIRGDASEQLTIPYNVAFAVNDSLEIWGYFTDTSGTLTNGTLYVQYVTGDSYGYNILDEGVLVAVQPNINFTGNKTITNNPSIEAIDIDIQGAGIIAETTTTVLQTSISFTGLPNLTEFDLEITSPESTNAQGIAVVVNGDTTVTNYRRVINRVDTGNANPTIFNVNDNVITRVSSGGPAFTCLSVRMVDDFFLANGISQSTDFVDTGEFNDTITFKKTTQDVSGVTSLDFTVGINFPIGTRIVIKGV